MFGGFIIEDTLIVVIPCGQGGDVGVWSFQRKNNACGDGGMITSNDKELIEKCREMTWFGFHLL